MIPWMQRVDLFNGHQYIFIHQHLQSAAACLDGSIFFGSPIWNTDYENHRQNLMDLEVVINIGPSIIAAPGDSIKTFGFTMHHFVNANSGSMEWI